MATLDLERAYRGLKQVYVQGIVRSSRFVLIEEAIVAIHDDGRKALLEKYMAFKNYAHFGDQRCDSPYGLGPTHGSVVFRISRTSNALERRIALDADAIYLLEAVRDFGMQMIPQVAVLTRFQRQDVAPMNLCEVLASFDEVNRVQLALGAALGGFVVEAHEPATAVGAVDPVGERVTG